MPVREVATLIGRERELEQLGSVFDRMRVSSSGVVLLSGEAGIGKSRLAHEAAADSGLAVHEARSSEQATPPYGPIATVLRSCLRRGVSIDEIPASSHDCLALLLPEIGAEPCTEPAEALVEAIAALLGRAAATEPTLVILDDLHWADEATLELLPWLVERLAGEPLAVLGAYRDDEISRRHPLRRMRAELRRGGRLREIALGALDHNQCEMLMEEALGSPPSPTLTRLVCEATDGVPLYIEELAAALSEADRLRAGPRGLELAPGGSLPIPETIRDTVVLRLEGLSEAARRQVEAAAVAGTEFDLDLVSRVEPGEETLGELLARGWISEREPGQAAFRHALIRDAVLREVTWLRRRRLHRRYAGLLAETGARPGLIAEHWLAARDLPAARDAWIESAQRSCEVDAYRDAARDASRALEIWPAGEDEERRVEVLERLAHCARVTGQLNEAARVLREVLDSPLLDGDPHRRGESLRALAEVSALGGAREQSLDARRRAAEAFEEAGLPAEAASELISLADRHAAAVQAVPGLTAVRRALQLAERADRIDLRAHALSLEGLLLASSGDAPSGISIIKKSLALALEHGLAKPAAEAYRRLGVAYNYNSDYPVAGEAFTEAVEFCQTHGNDMQRELCLGCMAWAHYQMGDWKRAGELTREVIDDRTPPPGLRAIALGVRGLVRLHRGELRQARKLLEESKALMHPGESVAMELIVLGALGGLAALEGDDSQAELHYRRLLELWERSDDRLDAAIGLCFATTFFAERQMEAEVSRAIDALTRIAATDNPEARATLAFAMGEIALMRGEAVEAADLFDRALADLEAIEMPFLRATTCFRAGVALIQAGDSEVAIERLRAGYGDARRLGARPLAAQIAAALAEQGVTVGEERSPDAASRASRAGLTRRQHEVVRLIAEGLTNREIGERLFLSTRTVDMHARNLFDRLDCRTRAEAVKKAAGLGLLADERVR